MILSIGVRSADRYRFDHLVLIFSLKADLSMADLLCSLLSETRRRWGLDDNFPSLTALLMSEEVMSAFNSWFRISLNALIS